LLAQDPKISSKVSQYKNSAQTFAFWTKIFPQKKFQQFFDSLKFLRIVILFRLPLRRFYFCFFLFYAATVA